MEAGRYIARVTDIDMGYAETGTPQYAVAFELVETGETITWYGFMTEKTAERTLQALRYCGWTGTDPGEIDAGDLDQEVELDIQWEEFNGDSRLKVKWVNRRGGRAALKNRMDDGDRKAFGAKFKGLALKVKPVPKEETVAAAAAAKGEDDDDLPF